jgi:hypothetical protein
VQYQLNGVIGSVIVRLTAAELMIAANIAVMRQITGLTVATQKYGAEKNNRAWENHITGAQGEMAVAKHFNLYWNGTVGEFDKVDVGGVIEVRAQQRKGKPEWQKLILHPADDDDLPYVLVSCEAPDFELIGWLHGRDGKLQKHWSDPTGTNRPAYFVPRADLHPIADLKVR